MNDGKRFEEDFYESFFETQKNLVTGNSVKQRRFQNISIDRVYDNTGGYAGVAGFCDFNVFRQPNLFHLELKHISGSSLPLANITDKQYSGLLEKSNILGICAGLVICFDDKDRHAVYFLDIRDVRNFKALNERKSIPQTFCELRGIVLEHVLKRTRYTYLVGTWLARIAKENNYEDRGRFITSMSTRS